LLQSGRFVAYLSLALILLYYSNKAEIWPAKSDSIKAETGTAFNVPTYDSAQKARDL